MKFNQSASFFADITHSGRRYCHMLSGMWFVVVVSAVFATFSIKRRPRNTFEPNFKIFVSNDGFNTEVVQSLLILFELVSCVFEFTHRSSAIFNFNAVTVITCRARQLCGL